jgi:Arc/MetJ-type ribon-helix-helix transcriptional regulator
MAKTRRSHYLDDETLAFIEDLRANGHAENKSQAVRKALKTAIDHLDEHGPGALAQDEPRRYVDLQGTDENSAHQRNADSDSVGVDRSESDTGSSSGHRRSVPNRNGGARESNSRQRDNASAASDEETREAGHHSALKNFNPFT